MSTSLSVYVCLCGLICLKNNICLHVCLHFIDIHIYTYIYIRGETENMKSLRETLDAKKFQLLMISTLTPTFALVNFTIPKTDIVHTRSGLILHYLSQYQPSYKIVTFTVTIPMAKGMCYLIPTSSMKRIPLCERNNTEKMTKKDGRNRLGKKYAKKWTIVNRPRTKQAKNRPKRFISEIISIGIGTGAMGISTANMIRISNLKNDVKALTNSLRNMDQSLESHQAQMLHPQEGQLKLAEEFNNTQIALNQTMEFVNEHTTVLRNHESALRTITSMTIFSSNKLKSFVHALETHFIHTSIEDILANTLNLRFIHHKDIPNVIKFLTQVINVSFDESNISIPEIELITSLLVRQQIDFIPTKTLELTENGLMIGKLLFTSYFAAPNRNEASYSVYELVLIPFNQGNTWVRLTQMPAFLRLDPKSQQFIRWSKDEAMSCNFVLMSSCRETPPIRKDWTDNCLYQSLTDSVLNTCRTELYPEPVFVHRVGQHWVVSTNSSTRCHSTLITDSDQHEIIDNDEIMLPPVALLTTMDTKSLTCDRFFLPGLPMQSGPTVNIIQNVTINPVEKDLVDLHSMLSNDLHWVKLLYIPSHIRAIIDFIISTKKTTPAHHYTRWLESPIPYFMIFIGAMMLVLTTALIFYIRKKKVKNTNFTITMPSMKSLQGTKTNGHWQY